MCVCNSNGVLSQILGVPNAMSVRQYIVYSIYSVSSTCSGMHIIH